MFVVYCFVLHSRLWLKNSHISHQFRGEMLCVIRSTRKKKRARDEWDAEYDKGKTKRTRRKKSGEQDLSSLLKEARDTRRGERGGRDGGRGGYRGGRDGGRGCGFKGGRNGGRGGRNGGRGGQVGGRIGRGRGMGGRGMRDQESRGRGRGNGR